MSQKSRELIEKHRSLIPEVYRKQFSGISSYTRIDLLSFSVLDMLSTTESTIKLTTLQTYLPVLYNGILKKDTVNGLIVEDKANFICDFNEGLMFQKPVNDELYLDFVALAKSEGPVEQPETLTDKFSSVLSGDLNSLYEKRMFDIHDFLKDSKLITDEGFDIYDMYDAPTSNTIVRREMDKSMDIYSM